jgi:hypothetical protein
MTIRKIENGYILTDPRNYEEYYKDQPNKTNVMRTASMMSPDELRERQHEDCRDAGKTAYHDGRSHVANPYRRDNEKHGWWYEGWALAADADPKRDQ